MPGEKKLVSMDSTVHIDIYLGRGKCNTSRSGPYSEVTELHVGMVSKIIDTKMLVRVTLRFEVIDVNSKAVEP
jgi:hypothetical protein